MFCIKTAMVSPRCSPWARSQFASWLAPEVTEGNRWERVSNFALATQTERVLTAVDLIPAEGQPFADEAVCTLALERGLFEEVPERVFVLLVALVEFDLDFGRACDDAEVVGETPAGIEVAYEVSSTDGGGDNGHAGGLTVREGSVSGLMRSCPGELAVDECKELQNERASVWGRQHGAAPVWSRAKS